MNVEIANFVLKVSVTGSAGDGGGLAFVQSMRTVCIPVITNATQLLTGQELIMEDSTVKKRVEQKRQKPTTHVGRPVVR